MTELQLLEKIASQSPENGFVLPEGSRVEDLTPKLLKNLGAIHGRTRELSYAILNNWIWADDGGRFTDAQLRDMAAQLASNLSFGLGETASDSVFLRAYSSLILGDIIGLDAQRTFFSEEQIRDCLEQAIHYFERERDYRTNVSPEKGWAHAVAHATDLFMHLANHPKLSEEELEAILEALAAKLRSSGQTVFLAQEDERLANAAIAVLKRDMPLPTVEKWLGRLAEAPTWQNQSFEPWQVDFVDKYPWWPVLSESPEAINIFNNTRTFVRSLYFQLKLGKRSEALSATLLPRLERAMQRLDTGYLELE